MVGQLREMGVSGDEKLTWDSEDDLQIKKAENRFKELRKQGFKMFVSKDIAGSKRGEEITEFDPNAQRIIAVPAYAGG